MSRMSPALERRYHAAVHRMQSATAFDLTKRLSLETAWVGRLHEADILYRAIKDVRVGLNSAMADQGALAALLIRKGVFTEEEYYSAIVEWAEREADARVQEVRDRYNLPDSVRFA